MKVLEDIKNELAETNAKHHIKNNLIEYLEKRLNNYNNQGSKSKNAENILFAKISELKSCINIVKKL